MVGNVSPDAGGLSNYILAVYTWLLSSAKFKQHLIDNHTELTGASTDNDFLQFMQFGDSVDDATDYDTNEIDTDENIPLQDFRPFVVIQPEEDFTWTPVGECSSTQFELQGSMSVIFTDNVRREIGDAASILDPLIRFTNWIDGTVADWNGTVPPVPVKMISVQRPPMRADPDERATDDYWDATLTITFGTGSQ